MGERDASYRRLFGHYQLLRDLLVWVLDADWVRNLDWPGLQEVNTDYVGDRLQQRQGDGAWRIPYRSRPGAADSTRDLYVLLSLEHQSQPETDMALRVATYTGLLYQSLLSRGLVGLPLPAVLPVVLYSGRRRWSAPVELSALIEPIVPELLDYQLQIRYLLIDEGVLLREGRLPDQNMATLLFRLEHSATIEEIRKLLHTLMYMVREPGLEELNRSFAAYLQQVVLTRAAPRKAVPTVTNLQEFAMMIDEEPGVWARQWEREGIQKGVVEGQATLLVRLLVQKFGPLPDSVAQRVRLGSLAQVEAWSLRVLGADHLSSVFEDVD